MLKIDKILKKINLALWKVKQNGTPSLKSSRIKFSVVDIKIFYVYFLLPTYSREIIYLGTNFQSGDFDRFTLLEFI